MDESIVRQIMARMAWQRAKGELMSILETFYNEQEGYDMTRVLFEKFIKEVEEESSIA